MRGISAVVAEVLLISLVIAMSLVALNFVMSVNSSTQASTENLAMSKGVGGSFITVDSVYCTEGNVLHIMLRNIGGEPVRGVFSVQVGAPSGTVLYSTTAGVTVPARGTNTIELNVPILENCTVPGYQNVVISVGTPGGTIVTWNGGVGAASVSVDNGGVSNTANLPSCSTVFGDPSASSCYRRLVTVKNNTSSELNDYTVMVDLDTNALIQQGKLQPDCNDIRFVLLDGTELNYWVENCGDTNTHIWVKIPEIPASGEVNVYLYYGDASAVGESNGRETFVLFDDFGPDHYDWNAPGLNVTYKPDQSVVELTMKDNANQEFFLPVPPSSKYAVYARMYCPSIGSYPNIGDGLFGSAPSENTHPDSVRQDLSLQGSHHALEFYDSSGSSSVLSSVSTSWVGDVYRVYLVSVFDTNVFADITDTNLSISGQLPYVVIFKYAGLFLDLDSGDVLDVDWVFVRKYVSPEPTVILGAEEQVS